MTNRLFVLFILLVAVTISGYASLYGPENAPENVAMVTKLDFGVPPTEEQVEGSITDGFLKAILPEMIDPLSTYIAAYQVPPYSKCIVESSNGSNRWLAGYCVSFSWNSKNRMGGYGGKQQGQGWVHIDRDGKMQIASWADDAEVISGAITPATGVYVLSYLSHSPRVVSWLSSEYDHIPIDLAEITDDDIIAKKLREHALAEGDPRLREALWDEYRKYKGLK